MKDILKFMTNIPESYEGLNKCISTVKRTISVPYCNNGCGHIFDPNKDEMATCPQCGNEGFKPSNKTGKNDKKYVAKAEFYYSPVLWKQQDLIIHDPNFRFLARRELPNRIHNLNQINSFMDADQSLHFANNYNTDSSTISLAMAEMVDGISRSISNPENMTAQLIRYSNLPDSERNKYCNIHITALCKSEQKPHPNVFRRMLVGEIEYTQKGVHVPSSPEYILKQYLVSKHLDTKEEEWVNGCECYNSNAGCSRCKTQPSRAHNKKTAHYYGDMHGERRCMTTHIDDALLSKDGVKYVPIDVLLYPFFDGITGTAQDLMHPYSVVFGSILKFLKPVSRLFRFNSTVHSIRTGSQRYMIQAK